MNLIEFRTETDRPLITDGYRVFLEESYTHVNQLINSISYVAPSKHWNLYKVDIEYHFLHKRIYLTYY